MNELTAFAAVALHHERWARELSDATRRRQRRSRRRRPVSLRRG